MEQIVRLSVVVFLLLTAIFAQSSAQSPPSTDTNPFTYLKCWIDNNKAAYILSSSIATPNSYTVCFRIQGRNCSDSTSSCCKKSYIATFILDANSTCDGDVGNITASFNGQPISGLNISRPQAGPANSRLLTIPGLVINASTVNYSGSDMCIILPGPGRCPFNSLAVGSSAAPWTAALLSSDAKCCPLTRGTAPPPSPLQRLPPPVASPSRLLPPPSPQSTPSLITAVPSRYSSPPPSPSPRQPPPPPSPPLRSPPPLPSPPPRQQPPTASPPFRSPPPPPSPPPRQPPLPPSTKPPQPGPMPPQLSPCQTCLVWDVLGPNGTQASSMYNFFSNNSCGLVDWRPEYRQDGVNTCCDSLAANLMSYFSDLQRQGLILSGFDKPTCDRTSMRFCGTLANEKVGQQQAAQWSADDLPVSFDVSDDTCPMSLINSTVHLYSMAPSSALADTCLPINLSSSNVCSQPDRSVWEDDYTKHFPTDSCDETPGIMPFAVDPFVEPTYGESVDTFCINVRPVDVTRIAKTPCNNTAIRRISFWLWDDPGLRADLRSVYLMLLRNGTYTKKFITRTWGQEGSNTLTITGLGLDATTIRTAAPKVCFDFTAYTSLWYITVDPLGFLWTALYDSNGSCCPTYYSNRY